MGNHTSSPDVEKKPRSTHADSPARDNVIYRPANQSTTANGVTHHSTVTTPNGFDTTTLNLTRPPNPHSVANPLYHSYNNGNSSSSNGKTTPKKARSKNAKRAQQSDPAVRARLVGIEDGGENMTKTDPKDDSPCFGCKDTPENRARFWFSVTACFTALNVALLAAIVLVAVHLSDVIRTSSNVTSSGVTSSSDVIPLLPEDAPYCLPCSDVYMTSLEVMQNVQGLRQRQDEESQTLLCCADSHDDLDRLLGSMFLGVQYSKDRASGDIQVLAKETTTDNVHLILSYDTGRESEEVKGRYTLPLKTRGREFSSADVIFRDDVIVVNTTGHYYIYSHVPLQFSSQKSSPTRPSPPPLDPAKSVPLSQYVLKVRNGGTETVLLENSVFPCDVKAMESCQHSFVAGIFGLEEGDAVALRVSERGCVDKEKEMQFGIHRI